MSKRYKDKEWLESKYHDEGLTQREIGEMCGVSASAVRKYMKKFDIPTRELKGENHPMYGKERNESVKKQISESLVGREFSEETRLQMAESRTGNSIPEETRKKISNALSGVSKSEETRRRMSKARLGDDVDDWGPDRWEEVAYGSGWKGAREAVVARDVVCQQCGADETDRILHVHHIIPLRLFRHSDELSFEDAHQEGNLILLCQSCHVRVEWGDLEVKPDFDSLPDQDIQEYRNLWITLLNNS